MFEIRPYEPNNETQVIRVWIDCGLVVACNNPYRDINRKLDVQPELFLVGCLAGRIVASVMAGYVGHRGWINYLAVHPSHQHTGICRRMMDEAEIRLRAANCPKINLQVRRSNTKVIEF